MAQNRASRRRSERASSERPVAAGPVINLLPIVLPKPRLHGGGTLLSALKKRKTTRAMGGKKVTVQMLSDILWAACGVNRKKGPFGIAGRTAASASNSQEIVVYVALSEGTYLYDDICHTLTPVAEGDLRPLAIGHGQMKAGSVAPVRLIYVVDKGRFSKAGYQEPGLYDPDIQKSYYYVDTGLIAQNVYLFAASRGLATWFHNCNKQALAEKLNLRADQRALFGQTVGYPRKDR
jgi:hypothetical protein